MNLDQSKLQMISNIIVLFGVIVAIVTIIYNVRTAKKTQTAAFLFESRKDKDYIESLHILKKAHQSGKSFRSYVFPANGTTVTDAEMDERRKFQYILNFYERVAVSIRQGIYNEEMIKRTSYTTVIETWDIAEPLIRAIREKINSDTTYQEFEWLATRWKKKKLKKN
ncbi:TPA: DUF4760 domain-containing protein [Klebsiella pneumoniae]|uniref:DUF4760 domain-containing protein n=1 Tax=Klebsiella TaxID=570 RepID=UPI000599013F|nr:DUF4760 domain-containing protein [Klebsiella quasipneumoniae]KII56956.1 membrane protein [Klebsiella quasipneumoniae]HBS7745630.1 DUF4760 domain-containing protein [Klebsiella pneumoniae]